MLVTKTSGPLGGSEASTLPKSTLRLSLSSLFLSTLTGPCSELCFGLFDVGQVEQLLGMPEPSLVAYVTDLLSQHTSPARTYEELHPVLDADTETFLIKLYRMVIYETEKAAISL